MALSNTQLADKISALIDRWNLREDEMIDWINGTVGGGPNGDGRYPITDALGTQVLVTCPAQMEADVEGNVDSSLQYLNDTLAARDEAYAARDAAQLSETNAANSETNASTSETNAAQSASEALESATNASTSEVNAANSATAAATSETNAAQSATEAATSEANAKTSETNAATSASNAATSETNASASASAAATSETNASQSAAAASTSETNAANSETQAANHASSASTSETNAQSHANAAVAAKDAALLAETNAEGHAQDAADRAAEAAAYAAEVKADNAAAMKYRGLWDASTGAYPNPTEIYAGWLYKVSVGGTVDGVTYSANDAIIYNGGDVTLSSGWDKIDNTDAVSSVAGKTGNVTLTKADVGLGSVRNVDSYSRAESDTQLAGKLDVNANAVSASKLLNAQTIELGGDLTGSAQFDGSTGITISADIKDDSHNHTVANVDGLQSSLDSKLDVGAKASDSDMLDGKHASDFAEASHLHAIADVSGLQTELDGKADTGHTHAIADVSGLQTELDGKAATGHTHAISDVSGLQTELDGKADTGHTHSYLPLSGGTLTGGVTLPNSITVNGNVDGLEIDLGGRTTLIGSRNTSYSHYFSSTGHHYFYGQITSEGDVTAYSDRRVKTNIEPITNALEKLVEVNGVTFDRTDVEMPRQVGLIAQDVEKVVPEAVRRDPETGHLYLAYGNLIGLLVEAIKEQQEQINEMKEAFTQ